MPVDSLPGILQTPGLSTGVAAPSTDTPAKIRDAATQFEALLLGQILKSVHEEEGGWLGAGEDDKTASSAMQMADEYLARSLTLHGGLGLARMIASGLDHAASEEPAQTGVRRDAVSGQAYGPVSSSNPEKTSTTVSGTGSNSEAFWPSLAAVLPPHVRSTTTFQASERVVRTDKASRSACSERCEWPAINCL
jgi:Rod binding domain-containing protein